jgi:cytochrome c oxidase subunit II
LDSTHSKQRRSLCRSRGLLAVALLLGVLLSLGLVGCAREPVTHNVPNMLDPRGTGAREVANLWWIILGLGTAVFLAVSGLLGAAVYRRSQAIDSDEAVDLSHVSGTVWILWGGVLIPFVILMVTFFFGLRALAAISYPPQPTTVTIEVTGHRWWWEVRYPDHGIITANEIVIPVGQPVAIVVRSADVIHSFWVPQLHGKLDMTPGRVDSMWLQAEEAGVYRGLCAEFCGLQHAKMQFLVIAQEPERFNDWVEQQSQPAAEPADSLTGHGQQVFLTSSCVYCHTVRGTPARGVLGPDLTHLASRRTLAAGIIPNSRGHLAGWILDPQQIKPGNLMPPTSFSAEDLQALLAYLESLE